VEAPTTADPKAVLVNKSKDDVLESVVYKGTDTLTSAMDKRSAVPEESIRELKNQQQQQQRKRRANNKKRQQQQTTSNINDDDSNNNFVHPITTSPVQVSCTSLTDAGKDSISPQSGEVSPSNKNDFKKEEGTTASDAQSPPQEDNKSANPQQRPPNKKVKKDKSLPNKGAGASSAAVEAVESTNAASIANNAADSNNFVPLPNQKKKKPKPQRKKKIPIPSNQEGAALVKGADEPQKTESTSTSVSPALDFTSDNKDNNTGMELLNQEGNPNITSDITTHDAQNKADVADNGGASNATTNSKGTKKGKRVLNSTEDDLEGTSKSNKKSNIAIKDTTKFNLPVQKTTLDQNNRRATKNDRKPRRPDKKRTLAVHLPSNHRTNETGLGSTAGLTPYGDVCGRSSTVVDQECNIMDVETSLNHLKLAGEIIDQPIDIVNTTNSLRTQVTSSASTAELKSEAVVPIATTVSYTPESNVHLVKNEVAANNIGEKLSPKEPRSSVIDTTKQCGTTSGVAGYTEEPTFLRDGESFTSSNEVLGNKQPTLGTEFSADGECTRTNLEHATKIHAINVLPKETIQNNETSVVPQNLYTRENYADDSSQKKIVLPSYNGFKLEINAESAAQQGFFIAQDNASCNKTDIQLPEKDFVSQDLVKPLVSIDAALPFIENFQRVGASEVKHTEGSKPSPLLEDLEISMDQLKFSDSALIASDEMHVENSQHIVTKEDMVNEDHVKASSSSVVLQHSTPQDFLVSFPTRELAEADPFTAAISHVQKDSSNTLHEEKIISIAANFDETIDEGTKRPSEEISIGDPFNGAAARIDGKITGDADITNIDNKVIVAGIEEKIHLCNLDESFEHYTIDLSRSESNTISLLDNSSCCHPEDKLDKDAVSVVESTQHDNLICDASAAEVSTVLISNVNPNFVDARSIDSSRRKVIPRQTRHVIGSTTVNAFLPYNDDCNVNPDQATGKKNRCHECSGCIIS
jgi:hypothetical protein